LRTTFTGAGDGFGQMHDRNDAAVNVIGHTITLQAVRGINLDIDGVELIASNSMPGTIVIDDVAGGLNVLSATTNDGDITLTATDGDLELNGVVAGGTGNVTASTLGSGNILVGDVLALGGLITLDSV